MRIIIVRHTSKEVTLKVSSQRRILKMKVFALLVLAVALGYGTSAPLMDYCKICINFAGQFINQLIDIIANAGVIGGCADLCGMLENKTHNEAAGIACNILCDLVGIQAFVDILNKADLDPIYYCELLNTCPIKDDGDAKINSLIVSPNIVPYGSRFSIVMNFTSVNGTGTGMYVVLVDTVDKIPLYTNSLTEPQPPGTYMVKWDAEASPDPDCQVFCEMWLPGNYTVHAEICNGQCGSHHPHTKRYDRATAVFNVTKN